MRIRRICLNVDVTKVVTSYFLCKACLYLSNAIIAKAVTDNIDSLKAWSDEIKEAKKNNKDNAVKE